MQPGLAEPALPEPVLKQPERHTHTGRSEAPMPARVLVQAIGGEPASEAFMLRQIPGDEGPQECAEIDSHVEDREPCIATPVARRVQLSDDYADVWFQETCAE